MNDNLQEKLTLYLEVGELMRFYQEEITQKKLAES